MTFTGLVLIVVCIGVIALAVMSDKKASSKFEQDFKANYPVKVSLGNMSITENGKLVYYLPSGTLKGYKVWDLSEVGYISTSSGKSCFSICDKNMQVMAGDYMTPSKKNVKEKKYKTFNVGVGASTNDLVDFLRSEAGIQHMVDGRLAE
ncbi:MAG: hypothetical protein MJ172_10025 [Clostridia bacterium]|nr:hypothetical protein [Clostridia bacterium]